MNPYERFRAWMGVEKLNRTQAAERLGCAQSTISRIYNELHTPETELAVAIERATKESPLGVIAVSDWVDFRREQHTATENVADGVDAREVRS